MANFIVVVILVAIITLVIRYIVKEKKKGNKCIGCPNSATCSVGCNHKAKNK